MHSKSFDSLGHPLIDHLKLAHVMKIVNWEALLRRSCLIFNSETAEWGLTQTGAYNVVRVLQLQDAKSTVVIVRVPFPPPNGWSGEDQNAKTAREEAFLSEIATMKFFAARSAIPVPEVFEYQASAEDHDALSPYIIMSKIEGVPLGRLWDSMADSDRWHLLEQVADVLIEISTHRFDRIGALFITEGNSPCPSWTIRGGWESSSGHSVKARMPAFTSALEAEICRLNSAMQYLSNHPFSFARERYVRLWFIRSLLPSLIDPALDRAGFPICHGDFHTQNIMIAHGEKGPKITGIIDWEESQTEGTSVFAQLPLFVVDHPHWEDDNPLRQRNVVDRRVLLQFIKDAEDRRLPQNKGQLYRAYRSCVGIYLCEQIASFGESMGGILWPELLDWVEGDDPDDESCDGGSEKPEASDAGKEVVDADAEEVQRLDHYAVEAAETNGDADHKSISHQQQDGDTDGDAEEEKTSATRQYLQRLTTRGILKQEIDRLDADMDVFWSAQRILGLDLCDHTMSRSDFLALLQSREDQLSEDEQIIEWLRENE